MKELLEDVKKLTYDEYGRACQKFGKINVGGDHHSYGVIKEEIEEAEEELKSVLEHFEDFWVNVKNDEDECKMQNLSRVYNHAVALAAESIQVAAMAYKAQQTISALNEENSY